ncbi:hypothetical protein C8R44DRAFT_808763 [Mycena epipterygia]|nr:hypothetical protein C8R44DRAFT_808763 [Mycena epipterygia]
MTLNDKNLQKAKNAFLKHLKEVDTSLGPVDAVILKFRLNPAVGAAFDAFVRHHRCTMKTRIISRKEQNEIDPRQKSCAQFTSVLVTPAAQAAFLWTLPKPRTPQLKLEDLGHNVHSVAPGTMNISPEIDEQVVMIPRAKYDRLCTRLSDALVFLPTTDRARGKGCREELIDIAHELRCFRPEKRPFDAEEDEVEKVLSPKKARSSRD